MSKRALSVTLDPENILWLKARARGARSRSVSETLDRLLIEARAGKVAVVRSRSVKGTARIDAADPDLAQADDAVRRLIASSLSRPEKRSRRPKSPRG
jgi:hypothetical protein